MDELLLEDVHVPSGVFRPGGWCAREVSFARCFRALFKKQLKVRMRSGHVIFELGFSIFLVIAVFFLERFSRSRQKETWNPEVVWQQVLPRDFAMFMLAVNDTKLIGGPNIPRVQSMLQEFSSLLHLVVQDSPLAVEYVDTYDEMKASMDAYDTNGVGIFWKNADADDAFESPDIDIYLTCILKCPYQSIYQLIRAHIAKQAMKLYEEEKELVERLGLMNVSSQHFPYPDHDQLLELSIVFILLLPLPCLLVTMSDFDCALEEKENKVQALMHMCGCGEAPYWFVMFVVPLLFAVVPYVVMVVIFVNFSLLTDVSFSVLLVASLLYVMAHLCFVYTISTFLGGLKEGRAFSVVYQVALVVMTYIIKDYAMHADWLAWLRHVMSFVPAGAYMMTLLSMFENVYEFRNPVSWTHLVVWNKYPVRQGLAYLVVDLVIYSLVFLVLNATLPRQYGSPPLASISNWKSLFRKRRLRQLGMTGELITVRDLCMTYPGARYSALQDVAVAIKPGELVIMIGANGAGKSTFVNTLVGLIKSSSGELVLDGETVDFSTLADYVGVVFQENVFIGKLTTRENLELFGVLKGLDDDDIQSSIEYFASTLKLEHTLGTYADKLSGGEKRKLCIAMALLGNPPIIVMDEPTAGVDVQSRQVIWKTLALFKGATSLITSHALEESESISNRLLIMAHARLMFSRTPKELRQRYHCGYVLKIDNKGALNSVLELARQYDPEAAIDDNHLKLPMSPRVGPFITALESQLADLHIRSYSISVDHLEDILVNMINSL